MYSKNCQPTVAQKRLHEHIRRAGSPIPGFGANGFQLHHLWGSCAKHNKLWIGQYAVLLLPTELHDPGFDHPNNITKHPQEFVKAYGEPQHLCMLQYIKLALHLEIFPEMQFPDDEILLAIMGYHK